MKLINYFEHNQPLQFPNEGPSVDKNTAIGTTIISIFQSSHGRLRCCCRLPPLKNNNYITQFDYPGSVFLSFRASWWVGSSIDFVWARLRNTTQRNCR